jgi:hypothetical protein
VTDSLNPKILALHSALRQSELPHAFGGALALAFCTGDPRATKDIDLNVFIGVERLDDLVAALPPAIQVTEDHRRHIDRDGQARLWWGPTPVDVFLSNHPFHDHVAASIRTVPFPGADELPVLSCFDLAVFKTFFARPKDVSDVYAMVKTRTIDRDHLERTVTALLGEGERERFFRRLDDFLADD